MKTRSLLALLLAVVMPCLAAEPAKSHILIAFRVTEQTSEGEKLLAMPRVSTTSGTRAMVQTGEERKVALGQAPEVNETVTMGITVAVTPQFQGKKILLQGSLSRVEPAGEPLQSESVAQLATKSSGVAFVMLADPGKPVTVTFGKDDPAGLKVELTASTGPMWTNAAPLYWQAFAALPSLSEQELSLLAKKPADPIEKDAAKALLEKLEPSLALLLPGTMAELCDWGLDFSQGPALALPQLGKLQQAAKALRLRARVRLEAGDAEGVDDLIAALRLARHSAEPGLLINDLVWMAQERATAELAARFMAKIDRAGQERLLAALEALPTAHTAATAIEQERQLMIGWMRTKMEAAAARGGGEREQTAELYRLLNGLDSAEKVPMPSNKAAPTARAMIDGLEREEKELARIVALPAKEAAAQLAAYEKRIAGLQKENPLAAMTLPAMSKVYAKYQEQAATLALLRAGLLLPSQGPASLQRTVSPWDGTPFVYAEVPGGFELQAQTAEGKTVSLHFSK